MVYKMKFDENEFKLVHGAIVSARLSVFMKACSTTGKEMEFYDARVAELDALLKKFSDTLVADKSQDAATDDNEEEEA